MCVYQVSQNSADVDSFMCLTAHRCSSARLWSPCSVWVLARQIAVSSQEMWQIGLFSTSTQSAD